MLYQSDPTHPTPLWQRAWEMLVDFLASHELLVFVAASLALWLWVVRRIVNKRT
ncbi:MAG: hypothetical protein ACE5JR_01395 [Gemmatimonadota bacterium]